MPQSAITQFQPPHVFAPWHVCSDKSIVTLS